MALGLLPESSACRDSYPTSAKVPESRNEKAAHHLDWFGAFLATAGLGGITYALIEWPARAHRDGRIITAIASLGILSLAAFVAVEHWSSAPMVSLTPFRSRNFAGGNLLTLFLYAALGGLMPLDEFSSHIIHLGYMVRDDKAENEFYRALLGFRPYWFGGRAETPTDWISQQVPDGTDWIEYMMVRDPENVRIPASVTKASLGTMDHIALGVPSMKTAYETLYTGDRLKNRNAGGIKIARDGKWQFNMYDADDTRVELMEFQPTVKPCCSPFTASHPTR